MKRFSGIFFTIISAIGFGTLAIFGRFLYADGLDTFSLLFLRFIFAASIMAAILILRREAFPRGRVLAQLVGMGALGYAGQSFLYLSAIKFASAGLVALLLYLYPIFVFALSAVFLHEKATWPKTFALTLALTGAALTVNPQGGQVLGIVSAILAAVVYSIYIVIGAGVTRQVSAIQSSLVIFASAAAVYGTLALINGLHFPAGSSGWLSLAGIVILATVIPVTTFLAGLERIGPTNVSLLSTLEPIVTVLLAAWLFDERLAPITLIGGALILAAAIILTRSEMKRTLPPEV